MQSSARPAGEGVLPLKDCVRVLNGFGKSLEVILPRLREGFVTPDNETARTLALSNPQAFFLSPSGDTFHNVTVTGGKPRTQGPLALKRELAEIQKKVEALEADLSQNELSTAALTREIAELTATLDARNHERRDTERESANSGAALRQMESEASRLERRLQDWQLALARNKDQRSTREELIARKRDEAERLEAERAQLEEQVNDLTTQPRHPPCRARRTAGRRLRRQRRTRRPRRAPPPRRHHRRAHRPPLRRAGTAHPADRIHHQQRDGRAHPPRRRKHHPRRASRTTRRHARRSHRGRRTPHR